MEWVFAGLLLLEALLFGISRKEKRRLFRDLPAREHRIKILYPMAAWILRKLSRKLPESGAGIVSCMKSLYVKENVEREAWLYRVKKLSLAILIATGSLLLGLFYGLSERTIAPVEELQRADYGEGSTRYALEVSYRNQEEDLELEVEPMQLTEDEIRNRLSLAFEEIKPMVLGENPSQEEVTKPLQLISEYQGILISWEIADLDAVNYSGQIKAQLEEHETKMVNLFATLSLENVSEVFLLPICLAAPDLSANEKLLQRIQEQIKSENDPFAPAVKLPTEIDGYRVDFWEPKEEKSWYFLLLAILGMAGILCFYDRSLKQQVEKRKEQMMADFTEIVSKLSLLYEAGLSIHGAFSRIVSEYESKRKAEDPPHFAYQELRLVLEKIDRGVSEADAYAQFGKRCGLYPYMKLGNLLEQNLSKGTKGMKVLLKQEVEASFEERKRNARKKGEEASTRLLLPMILMMLVVIAVIAVPALMSVHM